MKKTATMALVFLLGVAALAFAHAGELHTYMGTIGTLNEDGSFLLKTTDDKTVHVRIAATTRVLHADDRAATAKELKEGLRVVVKMAKDGKTALSVKMAAARGK